MSDSAREIAKSSAPQELFELLSRQVDQDLGEEETGHLSVLESAHPDAAAVFRQQLGQLSCQLKQIPVGALAHLLFKTPSSKPLAEVVPETPINSRRSGSQRVVVGVVTSLLCTGLLFALFRKTETRDSAFLAKAEVLHGTMEARGGIGGAGRLAPMAADAPPVAGTMQMKIAADLSPQVLMGAAASGESAPEGETTSESPSEASVQPLIQSDDWNVIVVRIDSKDRDQAMDQIQSIAKKAGLQLKGAAGPEESRWLGVVLASDVAGRDEVVNAMEGVGASSGYVTETPSVDSPEAMFIKAARESLKHPTRSELHHGKVFVALPSSTATNEENRVVAAVEKAAPENSESTTSERSALPSAALENPSTRSAKVSVKAVQDVTLVVFEFSNSEKSGPNSSGQQI